MSGGFQDLGLMPELVRVTEEQGWLLPSEVQDEAIPLILGGGDVMVAAETGSGKTGAFGLPAIQLVQEIRREAALAAAAAASSAASDAAPAAKKPRVENVVLNAADKSSQCVVSPDGLLAQSRNERGWEGVRGSRGVLRGRVYWEVTVRDDGLCRVGWATKAANVGDLGTDAHGYGFGGTGKKSNARNFVDYGEAYKKGDVVGCYAELTPEGGRLEWAKNGKLLGEAFKLPKGCGALYPAVCMKNAELGVNFGATDFVHAPAGGYVALEKAPPADLTLPEGAGGAGGAASSSGGGSGSGGGASEGPVCIILEPTRDLAEQTYKVLSDFKKHLPSIRVMLITGGKDVSPAELRRGVDVVVATPTKLIDVMRGGGGRDLPLHQVRLLILDEADRFADAENMAVVAKLYNAVRSAIAVDAATPGRLQVCFFSATLHSPEIGKLSDMMCQHPTWVDLKGKDSVPDTVHHVIVHVDPHADRSWVGMRSEDGRPAFEAAQAKSGGGGGGRGGRPSTAPAAAAAAPRAGGVGAAALETAITDGVHAAAGDHIRDRDSTSSGGGGGGGGGKPLTLEEVSEGIKRLKQRMLVSLIDSLDMEQAIIFCRTNLDCADVETFLTRYGGGQAWTPGKEKGKENKYSCCVLAGMKAMDARRQNLAAFKEGEVRFLICTDVAARGLDIKELPYVINMTLPDEAENYIHRIGRAGRAGRMGLAISLVAGPAAGEGGASAASPAKGSSGGAGGAGLSYREKVWYHSNCNTRGIGCNNTKLVDKGGCCIWYDEPAQLRAITARMKVDRLLDMPVTVGGGGGGGGSQGGAQAALPYRFSLPPGLDAVKYGEERGQKFDTSAHIAALSVAVESLRGMEATAQATYLSLKMRWPLKHAPTPADTVPATAAAR